MRILVVCRIGERATEMSIGSTLRLVTTTSYGHPAQPEAFSQSDAVQTAQATNDTSAEAEELCTSNRKQIVGTLRGPQFCTEGGLTL